MSKKIKFIIIITAVAFCIVFSGNIYSSVKSYRYRVVCNQYRESLIATENANRALDDRLGRIAEVVGQLHETTERNVTDARGIIELIEQIRTQIQELENICYDSDTLDSYYDYWDSYYHDEGLIE